VQVSSADTVVDASSAGLSQAWLQQSNALPVAPQLLVGGPAGIVTIAGMDSAVPAPDNKLVPAVQYGGKSSNAQLVQQFVQPAAAPAAAALSTGPLDDYSSNSSNSSSSSSEQQLVQFAEVASAASDSSSSSGAVAVSRVEDPLAALSAANPVAAPLIQVGSQQPVSSSMMNI
jgi:hypothetical protein